MTPPVPLLSAPGAWTVERVPLVEATVRGLLAPAGSRLVVDLSATRFLASAGLTFLIHLGKRLADAGGGLALATASFITSGGTADASATSYAASARQFPIRRIATRVEANGDIRVDGPHRTSGTTDLLFSTLELNIGFASLSTGSVLRMSSVGLS